MAETIRITGYTTGVDRDSAEIFFEKDGKREVFTGDEALLAIAIAHELADPEKGISFWDLLAEQVSQG